MALPSPAYAAYRTGNVVARALPDRLVPAASAAGGGLARLAMRDRRAMVRRHQRRVRPELGPAELDDAVEAVFRSYANYWLESFRLPGTAPEVLDARLRTEGFEHLQSAYDAGNGVVLAMPHLGAWEWAAFWLTTFKGIPVSAVVEAVEPPELADWFVGLRSALGMEVLPLNSSAGTAAARALRGKRVLTLMCDRDVAGSGTEVEFFGERTTLPSGPATLALRSGAPLIPATVLFDGDDHFGVALEPLDTTRHGRLREDVARVTQDLANALERLIRMAPEQWHLLQPNWPSDHAHPG